jgi:uncharacterized membrane protein
VRFFSLLAVWLHLLAAMIWIGGMVFLAVILVPITRSPTYRALAPALISQSGRRFRWVGWGCLVVLLVTGLVNLTSHGFTWADVRNGRIFAGGFGHTLAAKLLFVSLVLVLSVVHDFFIGPRAAAVGQSAPDSSLALRLRRQASWLGRLNLFLSLIIVTLAVLLVRG